MFNPNRFTLGLAVLALAPALSVADASAATVSAQDPPSVTVRYYDLSLNSSQGVTVLYQRIRGAAGQVCRSLEGREPLELQVARNDCFAHSVANAVRAVHYDALSAYHWQQIRQHRTHENDAPTSVASR
jgi:UrcA family protein